MTKSRGTPEGGDRSRFRSTLIRVLLVQAVALGLLALLQIRYGG